MDSSSSGAKDWLLERVPQKEWEARNDHKETPLLLAVRSGQAKIARMLVEAGADLADQIRAKGKKLSGNEKRLGAP